MSFENKSAFGEDSREWYGAPCLSEYVDSSNEAKEKITETVDEVGRKIYFAKKDENYTGHSAF